MTGVSCWNRSMAGHCFFSPRFSFAQIIREWRITLLSVIELLAWFLLDGIKTESETTWASFTPNCTSGCSVQRTTQPANLVVVKNLH